jgi:hypothetical protein
MPGRERADFLLSENRSLSYKLSIRTAAGA